MLPPNTRPVAAVNIRVAIETGPGKKLVLIERRRATKRMRPCIRLRKVSAPDLDMAVFAELGRFPFEESPMIAAVGLMAGQAVLGHRRVLPHKRAAFLRVAPIAQLIDGVGLDQLPAKSAVDLMAIGAADEAFDDGMMRLFVELGPDVPMAGEADLRLRDLEAGRGDGMNGMAPGAGDDVFPVRAHVPEHRVPRLFMAGQASG